MNILRIPIIGLLIASIICFFVAIPVWVLWNWLAPMYFYWLPQVYLSLPFWHVFGLLWLIYSLRGVLLLPSMNASATGKKD